MDLDYNEALVEGSGVYIEELIKEMEERNIKILLFMGWPLTMNRLIWRRSSQILRAL